jgi:hypothetical protein
MGIMFDGETDKSVCEMELIYARLVINGRAENVYVRVQSIAHAHADRVFAAIN